MREGQGRDPDTAQLSVRERIDRREAAILGQPARIETPDREAVAADVVAATARLRESLFGDAREVPLAAIPQIMFTMQPYGAVWERVMALSMQLLGPDARLSKREQKLAILRTGWLLQAPYEFGEHVQQAKAVGMTSAEIDRIVEHGSAAPEWTAHECAILRAAEELHADAAIADATWDALSAGLSREQIFELLVLVGQFTTVAYFQNAMRLRLEANNEGLSSR